VISALLLAGLFFQLGIEQRLKEIGTLLALGFSAARIRRIFLAEWLVLSIAGAIAGTAGAAAYPACILYGLRTWWRGAVRTGLWALHVSGESVASGGVGGMVIALLTIFVTSRTLRKASPSDLLHGSSEPELPSGGIRGLMLVASIAALGGIALVAA